MEQEFGLIGYPLAHSASPGIYRELFTEHHLVDCRYRLFPLSSIEQFPELIYRNPRLVGLNVTIPYKVDMMHYLDISTPIAQHIGSVNCLRVRATRSDIRLEGTNTDAAGFEAWLKGVWQKGNQKALILGNGGSSRAVQWVLKQWDVPYVVVSRRKSPDSISWDAISEDICKEVDLVVNTTPLGMFPETAVAVPFPKHAIHPGMTFLDLIYNPAETASMQLFKTQGAKAHHGMPMLQAQAMENLYYWGLITR